MSWIFNEILYLAAHIENDSIEFVANIISVKVHQQFLLKCIHSRRLRHIFSDICQELFLFYFINFLKLMTLPESGSPFENLLTSSANSRLHLPCFLLVCYLQVRATLLSLGNQAEPLPSKVLMHSALIQILLSCLFPFFLCWCCFKCCI